MIEPSKSRSRPRTRRSELERLIDRTILEPTHPQLGTCWRFTGTTTPYGRIAKAQDSYTHRLGWKLLRGPIPEGKELHHRCGVYACWNPDHLMLVTTPRTNSICVRPTANTATRCLATTCGSVRTGRAPVERATQRTSERSASAS
jgi:HNH endonuclease